MSIIEDAMEILNQLAEKARAARLAEADTTLATLPDATQQPHPLKLQFLRANKTPVGPTIDINFSGSMTDGNGALTKPFKQACAATVTAKLSGIRWFTLTDARSAHVFRPTSDGPLEQADIELDRLVGWMRSCAPTGHTGALRTKLMNAFGPTPPWAPEKTWEQIIPAPKM